MQTWEYKTGVCKTSSLEKVLNDLGEEGWELVSAEMYDSTHDGKPCKKVYVILKRPRLPKAPPSPTLEI